MPTPIRQELDEQFLSASRTGREIALDALKPLVKAVHDVIPAMPAVRVPLTGLPPTAHEAMAGGYDFAGHRLANQRQPVSWAPLPVAVPGGWSHE